MSADAIRHMHELQLGWTRANFRNAALLAESIEPAVVPPRPPPVRPLSQAPSPPLSAGVAAPLAAGAAALGGAAAPVPARPPRRWGR